MSKGQCLRDYTGGTAASPRLLVSAAACGAYAAEVPLTDWDYVRWAGALRGRPVLIVTADDQNRADMEGLAAALRKNGSAALQHAAVQSDHSFSDRRIALQTIGLRWLESLTSERR